MVVHRGDDVAVALDERQAGEHLAEGAVGEQAKGLLGAVQGNTGLDVDAQLAVGDQLQQCSCRRSSGCCQTASCPAARARLSAVFGSVGGETNLDKGHEDTESQRRDAVEDGCEARPSCAAG